jgi:hypothetical protein
MTAAITTPRLQPAASLETKQRALDISVKVPNIAGSLGRKR